MIHRHLLLIPHLLLLASLVVGCGAPQPKPMVIPWAPAPPQLSEPFSVELKPGESVKIPQTRITVTLLSARVAYKPTASRLMIGHREGSFRITRTGRPPATRLFDATHPAHSLYGYRFVSHAGTDLLVLPLGYPEPKFEGVRAIDLTLNEPIEVPSLGTLTLIEGEQLSDLSGGTTTSVRLAREGHAPEVLAFKGTKTQLWGGYWLMIYDYARLYLFPKGFSFWISPRRPRHRCVLRRDRWLRGKTQAP